MATSSNVQNSLKLYGAAKTNGLNINAPNLQHLNTWKAPNSVWTSCPTDATSTNALNKATNIASAVAIVGAVASLIQPAIELAKFIKGNGTNGSNGAANNTPSIEDKSINALDSAMKQADKTSDYEPLQTAVKQSWTDYNANQASIAKADTELQTAQGQVDTAKGTITNDEKTVDTNKSNVETAQNGLKTAETGVTSAQGKLAAAKALPDDKDGNKAKQVEAAEKELKTAEDAKKEAQDSLDKAKNELQTSQEKLQKEKEELTKLQQAVEDKTKAKADLVKKNEELKAKIEKANATLDKRGKKVENTEGSKTVNSTTTEKPAAKETTPATLESPAAPTSPAISTTSTDTKKEESNDDMYKIDAKANEKLKNQNDAEIKLLLRKTPSTVTQTSKNEKTTEVQISLGDTLTKYAKAYNTTIADLQELNGMGQSTTIYAGRKIKVYDNRTNK